VEPLLTPSDTSKILSVPIATLYTWVARGQIPFTKIGHLLRFERATLADWIAAQARPVRTDEWLCRQHDERPEWQRAREHTKPSSRAPASAK